MLGDRIGVSQWVTNGVVLLGWAWVFSLLFALPIALYVVIWNMYATGTVPDISTFVSSVNPGFVLLGGAAALMGFVLVLSNTTFGRENVDAAIDQGEDIADQAEEQNATDAIDEAQE
jgi:hypothetical protein